MTTPEERAARAERRAVARRHHPDLGGDAGVFAEEMRRLQERTARRATELETPATPRSSVTLHRSRRGRAARLLRSTPGLLGRVRQRLPRSFPGSRRYGRL